MDEPPVGLPQKKTGGSVKCSLYAGLPPPSRQGRATAPRSITAWICGDPAPGESALDKLTIQFQR
jgi:hypothetical protein